MASTILSATFRLLGAIDGALHRVLGGTPGFGDVDMSNVVDMTSHPSYRERE